MKRCLPAVANPNNRTITNMRNNVSFNVQIETEIVFKYQRLCRMRHYFIYCNLYGSTDVCEKKKKH
jgi:hypothetical protein